MGKGRVHRRLAAILAADVVGYSRLMGVDEEETLARFNAHREFLSQPLLNTAVELSSARAMAF